SLNADHRQPCRVHAESAAIVRWLSDRGRRRVRNSMGSSQRIKIACHVEKQRRDVNQTVYPVKDAAVTGNAGPHVLDANVTLDDADGQVTKLPAQADNQTGQQ